MAPFTQRMLPYFAPRRHITHHRGRKPLHRRQSDRCRNGRTDGESTLESRDGVLAQWNLSRLSSQIATVFSRCRISRYPFAVTCHRLFLWLSISSSRAEKWGIILSEHETLSR